MSAEILREAAASMRERALAAPDQPPTDADITGVWLHSRFHLTTRPATSLAVADWLEKEADAIEFDTGVGLTESEALSGVGIYALAVARAHLGRDS